MEETQIIYTKLMGNYFRGDDARNYLLELTDGTECQLVPEPTNPYDPNAIAVMHEEMHLGYIQKEIAAEINPENIVANSCIILGEIPTGKPTLQFSITTDEDNLS